MDDAIKEILHTTHYDGKYAINEDVREIWRKNTKEFVAKGRIDVRQTNIESIDDLIDVFKIFRDTRFETFRVVYVNENSILGSFGVSSHIPNVTQVAKYYSKDVSHSDSLKRMFHDIQLKMDALGATGIYLVHNHPRGSSSPSNADLQVTQRFKNAIGEDKILGHFVIAKDSWMCFNTDEKNGNLDYKVIGSGSFDDYVDENKAEYFDAFIGGPSDVAKEARKLSLSDTSSALIYQFSKGDVCAIQDVDNYEFNNENFKNQIQNYAVKFGASRVFLVTRSEELFDKYVSATSIRPFADILILKGGVYTSIHDSNSFPVEDAYAGKIFKRYSESVDKNK